MRREGKRARFVKEHPTRQRNCYRRSHSRYAAGLWCAGEVWEEVVADGHADPDADGDVLWIEEIEGEGTLILAWLQKYRRKEQKVRLEAFMRRYGLFYYLIVWQTASSWYQVCRHIRIHGQALALKTARQHSLSRLPPTLEKQMIVFGQLTT